MTTEELIKFLQKQEKKDILLNIQGIITATIHIEEMTIKHERNNLFLENKKNNLSRVGFNLNQLMKTSKIKANEVILEFDQLQKVTLTVTN